jgi:hypothetical protein
MIRVQNIEYATEGMRLHQQVQVDLTATIGVGIFVAPTDIVVRRIDFYPLGGNTFNTSQTNTITVRLATNSNATLGVMTTALSANVRNALTLSANNSLTMGTLLMLQYSSTCQTLSQVMCDIVYEPKRHSRANR